MATTKKTELITIQPIQMVTAKVRLTGLSPLIMHAWSAKAKREILIKELGFPKTSARDPKSPFEEWASSMYWLTPMPDEITAESMAEALKSARFGFPLTGIKQAALSAAYRMGWVKDKMSLRGAFFISDNQDGYFGGDLKPDYEKKKIDIIPNVYRYEPMVEIFSDAPVMREDMVKVGMGSADIRYRGEFRNWYCDIEVQFNSNGQYNLDQVLNIINAGGQTCGIGEWRPERDGQYGRFAIAATE